MITNGDIYIYIWYSGDMIGIVMVDDWMGVEWGLNGDWMGIEWGYIHIWLYMTIVTKNIIWGCPEIRCTSSYAIDIVRLSGESWAI